MFDWKLFHIEVINGLDVLGADSFARRAPILGGVGLL